MILQTGWRQRETGRVLHISAKRGPSADMEGWDPIFINENGECSPSDAFAALQQDNAYQRDLIYRMYARSPSSPPTFIRCRFPGEDELRVEVREWLDANPTVYPPPGTEDA